MVKKINKKAFTLIEVIVVIAIVGILVLLAVPRFIGHTQKAELVRIQHDVKAMEKEIGPEFINGDDEFNKWDNNSKDLNQLAEDKELFEKEGVAKEVDSTGGTYKIVPKEYKDKINTKLKGTFYANSDGKVYYEPGEMPEDSDEETKDTINPDDAKWVEKGNWGINGKWVVDKDGNAVIYAIDASEPIVFHKMSDENAKLPTDTLTSLTFQDKVQGDTNSSMESAFNYTFANLKTINNLDTNVDTSNVTNMAQMLAGSKLTSVGDLSKWNTSKVADMNYMFYNSGLTSVGDLSQWNTSNVTNMYSMFYKSQLTSVDLGKWNTANVTNMGSMFRESKLTSVGDLSQWNTSNVTNMQNMFDSSNLTSVGDLSQWNTSNVISMMAMFDNSQLTTVGDLDQWNTSNVYYMSYMFRGSKLTTVGNLSQWNTSNVTNMTYMFAYSKLTSVGDLSQWNTSNVTSMFYVFWGSNLTTVGDLSQWNTSKVTDMRGMFSESKLTSVGDLSKWDTSKVRNMTNMFYESKLTPPAWYHE